MAINPTYPGVYVQEVPSGVRTIVGVGTSIAMFIGRAVRGPLGAPVLCLNYSDFERVFSGDAAQSDLPRYVKLFFMNGGTQCYVMRIANGASPATAQLRPESGSPDVILDLAAKQQGLLGESIRFQATTNGLQPEHTFNLEIFRWETNAAGIQVKTDIELLQNLSMDPNSPRYAVDYITQNSRLVNATPGGALPALATPFSQSGRAVPHTAGTPATLQGAWEDLIGTNALSPNHTFQISVNGGPPQNIDLSGIDIGAMTPATVEADLANAIETVIQDTFTNSGILGITVQVSFEAGPVPVAGGDATAFLRIASAGANSVVITPGRTDDAAGPLMLGTAQGGLEISAFTPRRPAPNGLTFNAADPAQLVSFANLTQSSITSISLPAVDTSGAPVIVPIPVNLVTTVGTDKMYTAAAAPVNGNNDGVREKLALIRDAINAYQAANPRTFFWKAALWGYRLAILSTRGEDNSTAASFATAPTNIAANFTSNVRYYSLGISGTGGFQVPAGALASDGTAPLLADYDQAYLIIDKEVDLFNLLVLPPDHSPTMAHTDIWGPASVFCQQKRAFLLMDTPGTWTSAQVAAAGVDGLRVGLVKDHSAIFYPRLRMNEAGRDIHVGASGAIAGLMARIDANRGVWKAPAGTEADLRGIKGVEYNFSDQENGVLNPQGINTIRVFPNGIVNWGARTLDGDDDFASEWKYIPVRRTALFIEESLYRGLKWVVFEPNDEPLWAQIRLNVGAFMHNLFRQGAFQGIRKNDAYFVKCDRETTTQNDINLGIVNIWVGFAPLKPAEFVILYLQQMTGQIQV